MRCRRVSGVAAGAVLWLITATSSAAEPAWWTEHKRKCGLPPSTVFNSWREAGAKCPAAQAGAGAPSSQGAIATQLGTVGAQLIIQAFSNPQPSPAQLAADVEYRAAEARRREEEANQREESQRRLLATLKGVDREPRRPLALKLGDPKPDQFPPALEANDPGIIGEIVSHARKLGWSPDELRRLAANLRNLGTDATLNGELVRRVWANVKSRPESAELASLAATADGGLWLAGAGRQTAYSDCTIFALANGAGLPYGVVAARANELLREASWRGSDDREHPQAAIERDGLTGGEVILLAQTFGRTEVIPQAEFSTALRASKPVLINVVPPSGNLGAGHQVVLSKTFQRRGEDWFEMIDSNEGPTKRLYISASELKTIIQENGITFQPHGGSTPALLRAVR